MDSEQSRFPVDMMTGTHLLSSIDYDLCAAASHLMTEGAPFVAVARTVPGAIWLREQLDPTPAMDAMGVPVLKRKMGTVEVLRSRDAPAKRRAILQSFGQGSVKALILSTTDLKTHLRLGPIVDQHHAIWLVQDAHRMSFWSSDYDPSLIELDVLIGNSGVDALWLFVSPAAPPAKQELAQRCGIRSFSLEVPPSLPVGVDIKLRLTTVERPDRDALHLALAPYLAANATARGVVVLPGRNEADGLLVPAELASVAEEFGAHPMKDPGDDPDTADPAWLEVVRRTNGFILTEEPETVEILPNEGKRVVVRFASPASIETIVDEVVKLGHRGGGDWVYLGRPHQSVPPSDAKGLFESLADWMESRASQAGTYALDAQELRRELALRSDANVEHIRSMLGAMVGTGYLERCDEVRFILEVAESHRFLSPHIDHDRRYVELYQRYEAALGRLGFMEAVRLKLSARPAKDLRELSRLLGYSIAELNVLFNDLSREGIIVCRQLVAGNPDPSVPDGGNYEVTCASRDELEHKRAGCLNLLLRKAEYNAENTEALREMLQSSDPAAHLVRLFRAELPGNEPKLTAPLPASPVARRPTTIRRAEVGIERERVTAKVEGPAAVRIPEKAKVPSLLELDAALPWHQLFASVHSIVAQIGSAAAQRAIRDLDDSTASLLTLAILLAMDDAEAAAQCLLSGLKSVAPDLFRRNLPDLLFALDYSVQCEGEVPSADAQRCLNEISAGLPLLENLSPSARHHFMTTVGSMFEIEVRAFGALVVSSGATRWRLERRSIPPEIEATLYVAALSEGTVSRNLVQARLGELLMILATETDKSAALQLAAAVLAESEVLALPGDWWNLIRARAAFLTGDFDRSELELTSIQPSSEFYAEASIVRAELHIARKDALAALATLHAAPTSASKQERQAIIAAATAALASTCEEHAGCESCPLLNSIYCPTTEKFVELVQQNPLNEPRRGLKTRVEKRLQYDVAPPDVDGIGVLLDRFGRGWPESIIGRFIQAALEKSPTNLLQLSEKFYQSGMPREADQALRELSLDLIPLEIAGRFAKLAVAHGEVHRAIDITVRAALASSATVDFRATSLQLEQLLGRAWVQRIEGALKLLSEPSCGAAGQILRMQELRIKSTAQRLQLQQTLKSSVIVEIQKALAAYLEAGGEWAIGDTVVRESETRLSELHAALRAKIEKLIEDDLSSSGKRFRLGTLIGEAEVLGLSDCVERGREKLASLPEIVAEPPAAAPTPTATAGQNARDMGKQSEAARLEPRSRPDPPPRFDARNRSGAPSGTEAQNRLEPGARAFRFPDPAAAERESRLEEAPLDPVACLEAVRTASDDRTRQNVLWPAFLEALERDTERSIKLLRDAVPSFERRGVLDRPLARLVQSGKPTLEMLPRFRRVIEKLNDGHHFAKTLDEISAREHPDPWKQLLGQIRIQKS